MAKIWQISDGRSYVVNGDPGTTITYTNSPSNGTAAGKPVTSIPTGATSVTFPSNGSEVEISSDTATIDQVFNAAAAGSGSSSSGSGSAGGVTFQIVTDLPSQGAAGVIYLVKVSETGDDKFEEWIWVDSAWESIGTTAVDPTTYAKLIGGNTFEGNQVINGDLTVTGDVSGVTESNYNVVETAETTITPTGGTWVRYTGTETVLTVAEPGWDGEAEISYLETATPVDLQGVTWSPAKPILTGNGPFVYTLVHAGPGQILAGAYGYSTPTAEAIQEVVPMKWSAYTTAPRIYPENSTGNIVIGDGAVADDGTTTFADSVTIGAKAKGGHLGVTIGANSTGNICSTVVGDYTSAIQRDATVFGYQSHAARFGVAVGNGTYASGTATTSLGTYARTNGRNTVSVGFSSFARAANVIVIGSQFDENVDGATVTHKCDSYGTGSITIGAGANTLNTTKTVDGVETTVESSNSITIGCKASNTGADSIVIGAQASGVKSSITVGAGASVLGESNIAIGNAAKCTGYYSNVAIGTGAVAAQQQNVVIGAGSEAKVGDCIAVGASSKALSRGATALGFASKASGDRAIAIGEWAKATATTGITFGAEFIETTPDGNVTYTCTTEGTGSITIGAGANTLNSTKTVDGVETTVESSNSITIGCKASNSGADSVVIGAQASGTGAGGVAIGAAAKVYKTGGVAVGKGATVDTGSSAYGQTAQASLYSVAVGNNAKAMAVGGVSAGSNAKANADYSTAIGNQAQVETNAKWSVALGSNATVTNTTNADGTVTPSENTIVIGTGATASAPNTVVIGAGASGPQATSVVIGAGAADNTSLGQSIAIGTNAKALGYQRSMAIGHGANSAYYGTSLGYYSTSGQGGTSVGASSKATSCATAVGNGAYVDGECSIAIGFGNTVADKGVAAFLVSDSWQNATTRTKLYFVGANTPLAHEYYNGEAFMGYVVTDNAGTKLACGTRRLSELFPDNSLTQPASLDENGEWVQPKVFHPSDLDLPVEEPTEEPQEPEDTTPNIPEPTIPEPEPYTPLPVYPIVEPEDITTNIQETEPYTPLPVYPIVEPEVPEIPEM